MEIEGFKSPEGNGLSAQSVSEVLWKLGKVTATGGLEEVFIYITRKIMEKIKSTLNKKYSIESKAAEWSEKVVSRVKARILHTPLSLPATRLVETPS